MSSSAKLPPTKSGRATIVRMTDEQAVELHPGDVVLIESPVRRQLSPREVFGVRYGTHGDDGTYVEVPVVDLRSFDLERPLAYGVPELYRLELEPELPPA